MSEQGYVIFDLDGTLIESFDNVIHCLSLAVEKLSGGILDKDLCDTYRHDSLDRLFSEGHARWCSSIPWQQYKDTYDKIHMEYCLDNTTRNPLGVVFLKQACKYGFMPIVLTNKTQVAADKICRNLFPEVAFAAVIGRIGSMKVKDDNVQSRLEEASMEAGKLVAYVGNSWEDSVSATKLNIRYYDVNSSEDAQAFDRFLKQQPHSHYNL